MTFLVISKSLHGKPTFHLCYAEPIYNVNPDHRQRAKNQTCFELSAHGERIGLTKLREMCLHGSLLPCYVKRIVNSPKMGQ